MQRLVVTGVHESRRYYAWLFGYVVTLPYEGGEVTSRNVFDDLEPYDGVNRPRFPGPF